MTDKEIVIAAAEAMGWEITTGGDQKQRVYARGKNDEVLLLWDEYGEVHMVRRFNPLESISDAWMLVEAMGEKGYVVEVRAHLRDSAIATIWRRDGSMNPVFAISKAPDAITRASLKAIDGEGKA